MSSDYKPHGSISVNKLTPQRKTDDTYFGELVLKNARTGENVAQNVRDDIFEGNTAMLRKFEKKGTYVDHNNPANSYSYTAKLNFPSLPSLSILKTNIQADTGRVVDTIVEQKFGEVDARDYGFAQYSMSRNLYFEKLAGSIGGIEVSGTNKLFELPPLFNTGYTGMEILYFTDGTQETTTVPSAQQISIDDKLGTGMGTGGSTRYPGFYVEYLSGGKQYFFYSTAAKYMTNAGSSENANIFPIIAFQDNWNGELPYEACFGPEHPENIKRAKPMKAYGIDFETMSRQVFGLLPFYGSREWNQTYERKWSGSPKLRGKYATSKEYYDDIAKEVEIPAYQSDEWNSSYAKSYKSMMKNCVKKPRPEQQKFCDENPTERAYYDGLVDDKNKTRDGQKNITDVHMGIFASAKNLDEESCVALFYTFQPILGMMKSNEDGYNMNLTAGSLKIDYGFQEWTLCRRYGVADPIKFPPGVKNPKVKHGDYTVKESGSPYFDKGDKYDRRDSSYALERSATLTVNNTSPTQGGLADQLTAGRGATGYLELRVQDRPHPTTNEPRFLELRLIGPTATHIVDVIRDGEHGKSGSVAITGGLRGYFGADPDNPYSDVLVYPISYKASKEIKIFKRERFRRECTMVIIGSIKMEEVKWYQQGWFKIVMVVVSLVLSYFFGPMAYNLVALLQTAAVMAVLYVIATVIENPWIKAVLSLLVMVYTGYLDTGSLTGVLSNPALWVEATGMVVNAYIADEMIKLQEELKEFREMVNSKEKEMEKMKKEVGMDEHNAEWIRYIASLAPVETQEEFMERALKVDVFESNTDIGVDGSNSLPAPKE